MELPSHYQIIQWISSDAAHSKRWSALRMPVSSASSDPVDPEPCEVFVKTIHLLNPIDIIKEKYICPEHPLLPQREKTWKSTLLKLHSHNNQAYVDAVANFVLSRFRELNLTPHCILYYGSYTGISESYQYNITQEYDTYRQCRWFWKGMETHGAKLTVLQDGVSPEDMEEFYREITTCPFEEESDSEIELEPLDEKEDSDVESVTSVTFDTLEEHAENTTDMMKLHHRITRTSLKHTDRSPSSVADSESESSDDMSEEIPLDICLELPNMPVILIAQEAQDGVMDHLLDEDELDGHKRNTPEWEARWMAWLFQVVAALTFLQRAICFTHNDLHSNNILWRKTDKPYLYYEMQDGSRWRVPTYGKIMTIIDFGRSIFRLGRRLWVSDDHWPDQDAGDQYNFGPFFNPSQPKVFPNPSFDLCRLAVSLLDGLFDEPPSKKKGAVSVMSEENGWKVYETKSPLYNLLWSWTINDAGHTVYETEEGEEKYEGFELYIRIAKEVHGAVPKDQLHRPVFQSFIWKEAVPREETVYQLGM